MVSKICPRGTGLLERIWGIALHFNKEKFILPSQLDIDLSQDFSFTLVPALCNKTLACCCRPSELATPAVYRLSFHNLHHCIVFNDLQ